MSRLFSTRRLLLAAGILVAAFLAVAWFYPSSHYLFVPNEAQPLAERVTVENGGPDPEDGGIHYVDVTVRKASLLERLFPFLRPDGTTIVTAESLVPEGSTFEDRREEGRREMERSQQIAAAVALGEAGLEVDAEPEGARIEGVASDAPAADVLEDGDVILAVNDVEVRTPEGLRTEVTKFTPGETLRLTIRRDGKTSVVKVKTIASPDDPDRALIGIGVGQEADIELPVDVDFDLGRVGGPSAGLAFALEILEELGQDVDRGYRVVATGELELDGAVVPVGGIKQKTFGVRQADADVFIVPAGENGSTASRYADGVRVIPVESFQQALQELATLPEKT